MDEAPPCCACCGASGEGVALSRCSGCRVVHYCELRGVAGSCRESSHVWLGWSVGLHSCLREGRASQEGLEQPN